MTNPVLWIYEDSPEMQLRLRPLREHWEARGPGMLRHLQTLLPWIEAPSRIDVHLVEPQNGGGGFVAEDEIRFEAVLANRHPQLPEIVRLAWLIVCQSTKATDMQALALIPPTLASAEYVELSRCDEATIEMAMSEWLSASSALTGSKLVQWWNTANDASDQAAWNRQIENLS